MQSSPTSAAPRRGAYDIVIVGGAIIGSSIAWFLTDNPDFDGTILVIERDPTYTYASTSHTNSCMRQQFSHSLNIKMSQFAADFVRNFRSYMHDDPDVPTLATSFHGYLYLADTEAFAETLRSNQRSQGANGAATKIMTPSEIASAYSCYNVDDIVCGSHNPIDEGYFDGGTMFDVMRRMARRNGAEYISAEVVDVGVKNASATGITLSSGQTIGCGTLVNAAGPRCSQLAEMAGVHLQVEPRKRYTFVFDCAEPLEHELPLTIDPSGVHVRSDGEGYMAGCAPDVDTAVAFDDFAMDPDIWQDKVWPALAHRIPAFERVKVRTRWAGHYAYNVLDHNAIIGPHDEVSNFLFANGFSGHGLQQSPAVGRGIAELITHGEYRSLDLTPFGYERIRSQTRVAETAVI